MIVFELFHHLASSIFGKPIDDNYFIALVVILIGKLLQCLTNKPLFVVTRDDYRNDVLS